MKLPTILIATGLASLASALPIRIVTIDAPPSHLINIGSITHTPAPVDFGKAVKPSSGNWWTEVTSTNAPPRKWHATHPYGSSDHMTEGTDASLVPAWMYNSPLSSSGYAPVVVRPGVGGSEGAMMSGGGTIKLVTDANGVVGYQYVEAPSHGGIGCVFSSLKRMINSLSPHEMFIFITATILMVLTILRLLFLTILLLNRAHAYANERPNEYAECPTDYDERADEYPGAAARSAREVDAGKDEEVPAYEVVDEAGEKDAFLPPYSERS